MIQKKYVIIGASAAGISAAIRLRLNAPNASICIITQESTVPYNKCFLADYVSRAKDQSTLFLKSETFFVDQNIDLILNTTIVSIDSTVKHIISSDGIIMAYDTLLLAVGGKPFVPGVFKEHVGNGVFIFHTLENVENMVDYCVSMKVKKILIVGAGLSGLEVADALKIRFADSSVTIVDQADHVLHNQLTEKASMYLEKKMKMQGIVFKGSSFIVGIKTENKSDVEVEYSDGNVQSVDLIVCAMGTRLDTDLLRTAGIAYSEQGVLVNEFLQTSDSSIFAAGDCVAVTDLLTGQRMRSCMWADAMQQGMIAADAMTSKFRAYAGATIVVSTSFFGIKCSMTGSFKRCAEKSSTVVFVENENCYHHVIVDDQKRLTGFLLLGDTQRSVHLKRLLLTKTSYC